VQTSPRVALCAEFIKKQVTASVRWELNFLIISLLLPDVAQTGNTTRVPVAANNLLVFEPGAFGGNHMAPNGSVPAVDPSDS
jgi:hypothetical protein